MNTLRFVSRDAEASLDSFSSGHLRISRMGLVVALLARAMAAHAGDCGAGKTSEENPVAVPATSSGTKACLSDAASAVAGGPVHPAAAALGGAVSEIRQVRIALEDAGPVVHVQASGQLHYRLTHLKGPERVVLTFQGARLTATPHVLDSTLDLVRRVRMAQFNERDVRMVIDLKEAAECGLREESGGLAVVLEPSSQEKKQKPFGEQQPQPAGATKPKKGKAQGEFVRVDTRWRTYNLEGVPQYAYNIFDPFHQNRFKGDFPEFGQNWFMEWDIFQTAVYKNRRNLDFSEALASDIKAGKLAFFAHNNFIDENGVFGFEVRHNDDRFFPADFRIHLDGAADFKHDITAFNDLSEAHAQIFDAFTDVQLHNFGTVNFNQMFLRGGFQAFKSDFHGLIFNDIGLGGRVFGQALKNRLRYDVALLKLFQRDAVSNFFDFTKPAAHQVFITRITWEDFLVKGWNSEWSYHFNHDPRKVPGTGNDVNLNTNYFGATFNGNVGRFIFNPAIYGVAGTADHLMPKKVIVSHDVRAWTTVLDVEYPLDFMKFRAGYVYASGSDPNSKDRTDTGFDSISDAVVLFGGPFSYWTGEDIKFGKGDFTRANSFFPSLRGANAQASYVNPGLQLVNAGVDITISPRFQLALNENYFRFNNTGKFVDNLKPFVINHKDGGIEEVIFLRWKPLLRQVNDLIIIDFGVSVLNPLAGLRDAFGSNKPVYTVQVVPRLVF